VVGVAERGLHQEAVELRLRQSVGAGLFDWVLGRDHHERRADRMPDPVDGHPALFHHLKERGLCFGRGPVDLIRQHDRREDWPRVELELAVGLVVDRHAGHVGGQQVRRELDPGVHTLHRVRQCFGKHGLAGAREVLEQ
jgi:hypothetical protein